jgi:hypothetical protein
MWILLWLVAGVLSVRVAIIIVGARADGRDPATDQPALGSVSGSWLREQRATRGDGTS